MHGVKQGKFFILSSATTKFSVANHAAPTKLNPALITGMQHNAQLNTTADNTALLL